MRKSLLKKVVWALPVAGLFLTAPTAQAQDEVGDFIRAGQRDANKLVQAYLDPFGKSIGHNLNSGWFNSGKAMGLGRFDIRIYGTVSFAPNDAKSFDIEDLQLEKIRVTGGGSTMTPTIFGEDEEGPELTIYETNPQTGKEEEITSFNAPPGIGYDMLPLPFAQLSVGLIKDTEVAVRFIPETEFDDAKIGLWGIGVKHGIKQWIPGISSIPGFDITLFGGYTNLSTSYNGIEVRPSEEDNDQGDPKRFEGQAIKLTTKAWTMSLVASKTFSVITGYAGVRYSSVQTNLLAEGTYPVSSYKEISETPPIYERSVEDMINPIDVKMKDSQVGLNAGLRLKLAFFSIYGEYTFAKYPTAMAGIGLGWN